MTIKAKGEYQHPSIITPSSWHSEDAQRFCMQIRRVVDDLYQRVYKLQAENKALKEKISELEGGNE